MLTIGDAMGYSESAVSKRHELRLIARRLFIRGTDAASTLNQLDRQVSRFDDDLAGYPPLLVDPGGRSTFASAPNAGPLGLGQSSTRRPASVLADGTWPAITRLRIARSRCR
jgi:hypothetical protein